MRVTKKKNRRKQKPDEDRKHASDDDEGGEEQDEDEDEGQPGQHSEPSKSLRQSRSTAQPEPTLCNCPRHPAKNAEPDAPGRPSGPPLLSVGAADRAA